MVTAKELSDYILYNTDYSVKEIKVKDIPDVILLLATYLEKYTELTGPEKKQLVLDTVQYLIDEYKLLYIIDPDLVAGILESLIAVDKGVQSIHKLKKAYKNISLNGCCFQ